MESGTITRLAEAGERVRRAEVELAAARSERDEVLVEAHRAGASLRELARESGLSPERVRRVVGSDDGDTVNLRRAAALVGCDVRELLERALGAGVAPLTAGAEPRFRRADLEKL